MKSILNRYLTLMELFLQSRIDADSFKDQFFELRDPQVSKQNEYLRSIGNPVWSALGKTHPYPLDRSLWMPKEAEEIISSLYSDVECYSPIPDPHYCQIDEQELRKCVEQAHQRLLDSGEWVMQDGNG